MADKKISELVYLAGVDLSDADLIPVVDVSTAEAKAVSISGIKAAFAATFSSQAQTEIYTTEALGRAAVADGQAFKVQGSGDVAAYEYRRTDASTSVLIATYPSVDAVTNVRASPFVKTLTAANAAGDAELYARLLKGVVDVRLYGLSAADTYYIERVRRNVAGNWFIAIKRTSDAATVLQMFAPLTEPTDPTVPMRLALPGMVVGAYGEIIIRWSDFVAGATNTGLTMTLHADCLDRRVTSPGNSLPASMARIGQVPMTLDPGAFMVVNETTRTVSWPETRIIDSRSNLGGYYKLGAGSVTFDANLQIAWLDLIEAASYASGATIPASIVKKASYGDEGLYPNNYHGSAHQYPIAWSSGAGRVDVNPMFRLQPLASGTVYRDDIVVKADPLNNIVSVFVRANGNDAASLTYIHYRLYRHIAANADVWTIDGIWEVARVGYESFSAGKEIQLPQVEMLCALQEVGAADFMGGRAHGDEVITQTPTLLIDGHAVPLGTGAATWHHASEITFIQSSKLYRDASLAAVLTVPLADRKLWLTFRDGEMLADQRIEHLASYSLTAGYLAMLAPHRYETFVGGTSEDTASAQISGFYVDNVRMIPMDATAKQAGSVADDYVVATVPPVAKVKLWGSYGIACEMEVTYTSADILKNLMYVNRTSYAYNKAYIGFISGSSGVQAVTAGTKWQMTTRYRISSRN